MKLLGVLLCFNDGDLLQESLDALLGQGHDLIVWDHGSTDETPEILRRNRGRLLEVQTISRDFDFYDLYPAMSRNLIENYVKSYDWISWPDQDEFLEGPNRSKPYELWLEEVCASRYDWIRFNNYNFWFTSEDDLTLASTVERVRHYSLFPDCSPRVRSWRASATNIREFNHNPPHGEQWPVNFNLRHYPARSEAQLTMRVLKDRASIRRGTANYHYDYMKEDLRRFRIDPSELHFDDGISELDPAPIYSWRKVYGEIPTSE